MSRDRKPILGLFKTEQETLSAIKEIKAKGWQVDEVHSPIPSSKIAAALDRKKSRVGWFTLCGGITGFFSGFALAAFTATRWSLIVSGKPIVSWIPFFIIAFEFTILFAVIGNVLGMITQVGLPAPNYEENYNPECSGSAYGVLATCLPDEFDQLQAFFKDKGALADAGAL